MQGIFKYAKGCHTIDKIGSFHDSGKLIKMQFRGKPFLFDNMEEQYEV